MVVARRVVLREVSGPSGGDVVAGVLLHAAQREDPFLGPLQDRLIDVGGVDPAALVQPFGQQLDLQRLQVQLLLFFEGGGPGDGFGHWSSVSKQWAVSGERRAAGSERGTTPRSPLAARRSLLPVQPNAQQRYQLLGV